MADIGIVVIKDEVYVHAEDLVDHFKEKSEAAAEILDMEDHDFYDRAQFEITELVTEKVVS